MNLLEGIARVEQKDLNPLPLYPLGHAVGGRVAHLGYVGFVEQAIEPDIVHADLLGLGQLLVKRQRQFRGVHGQAETMSGCGLSSRAGGLAGCRAGPGLGGSGSQQSAGGHTQAGAFDGGQEFSSFHFMSPSRGDSRRTTGLHRLQGSR